jgi:hypothetical protein
MIKELIDRFRQRKAQKGWWSSPLGEALAQHTQQYFYGQPILKELPEKRKQKIISDFYSQVLSLAKEGNAFLKLREYIGEYAYGYASYQVLCLTALLHEDFSEQLVPASLPCYTVRR